MKDFTSINRLMGSHRNRDIENPLSPSRPDMEKQMDHLDPYWREREETEMVLFTQDAPLGTHMEYPEEADGKTDEPVGEPSVGVVTVSTDRHNTTRPVQRAVIQ